jgi:transcriptional regulator with XRE-family HTH domain
MSKTAKVHVRDPVDVWVGARVAFRRMEIGKNQSDLGRALGLTFQQVQKYEKGTNRISSSKLWAAAQFLDVPVSYFFEGYGAGTEAGHSQAVSQPLDKTGVAILAKLPLLSRSQKALVLGLVTELASPEDKSHG